MTSFAGYLLDTVGARAGERLALVADADRADVARATAQAAADRGLEVDLFVTTEDYRREADMPPAAIDAVDRSDVALLLVAYPRVQFGGHSEFRKRATGRGARVGFVTHVVEVDGAALAVAAETTRRMAELLSAADRAVVTSRGGSHLEFDLRGREARALINELAHPGAWGALPDYFEAAIAPREGTTEGKAVIDGTSLVTGIAVQPIHLKARGGLVADLAGGRARDLRAHLEAAGENATNVAELGIGTSHLVTTAELIGDFEDKKVAGTAHLGIGDNRGIGGVTAASIHTDVQMLSVTVELDGVAVVKDGRLRLP